HVVSEAQTTTPPAEPPRNTPAQTAAPAAEATAPKSTWRPAALRPLTIILAVGAAIAAALIVLAAWHLPPFGGAVVTANAYVRGRTTVIAPQVSGYITQAPARDYGQVHAGDVLIRIDDRIYRARVAQAQANVDAAVAGIAGAKAQLERAKADAARVDELVKDGSVSKRERDQTPAALGSSEARGN